MNRLTGAARDLLSELKRRKVFRVTGVYAVVAFMVVQVADIAFPALHLPAWTITLVVALAILGLPVALVLAWAFELTPDGVKREADPAAAPDTGAGPSHGAAYAGAIVVAVLVAAGAYLYLGSSGASPGAYDPIRSIAVLPFDNLSAEEENAFFAAGIHEEVLTQLSRVSRLKVISRRSVLPYANTGKSMRQIGEELGVAGVLEGSVQRYGDQIRVTAQLIDARTDQHLWAERFDRRLEDAFAIQSDVALAITDALRATLTPDEQRRLQAVPTEDLEAYQFYMRGRALLDQRDEAPMRRGVAFFERAVERDSTFARAWSGLADGLTLLADYNYASTDSVLPHAIQAARRALELDPELADPYVTFAFEHIVRGDLPAAVREVSRGLELQPSHAWLENALSWIYQLMGNGEEALESAKRAAALDPLWPEALANLTLTYLINGQGEKALDKARRLSGIRPDWRTGRFYEGVVLLHLQRFPEARAVLQDVSVGWAGEGPRATLALALLAEGDAAGTRPLSRELHEAGDAFAAGLLHAAFGDTERAFQSFSEVDDWGYPHFWPTLALRHLYPDALGPLRSDPRFHELLGDVDRSWGLASPRAAVRE